MGKQGPVAPLTVASRRLRPPFGKCIQRHGQWPSGLLVLAAAGQPSSELGGPRLWIQELKKYRCLTWQAPSIGFLGRTNQAQQSIFSQP